MKKYLCNAKLLLLALIVSLFFCTTALGQKTWTRAAGNDNWSSANNWTPVGVPTASDAVIIPDNALFTSVKVDINATCASLTINGGVHPLTFTVKTFVTFNVTNTSGGTGLISIGAPADGTSDKIIFAGEFLGLHTSPVVNCVGVTMADVIVPFSDDNSLQIWSGIVAISGNLTLNGSENRVFVDRGKLAIGGTFNNVGSLATINGSTVEYNGANQVMRSDTYQNLILSGSGIKSSAVTVNEKISLQGTATVSNTITYGSNAILEYKGSTAQITSSFEFPTNMPAKVIINNPLSVGLNSNKTIAKELVLTSGVLIAGNKLSMGANATPIITRVGGSMTGTLQSPANDYDVVYTGSSKTTGAELSSGGLKNITVNLSAATESLTLNQNRIPDGNLDITNGILNLSTFTINRSAAGGVLKVADGATLKIEGANSLPSNYTYTLSPASTVEYAGTNQTVTATTYGHCTANGSGTKTVSATTPTLIAGILTVQSGVAFTIGGANFTVAASTVINGTLNSANTTGTKSFRNMTINSGGLFNSTVNENYTIERSLIINSGGNIISGSGVWSFYANVNQEIIGGSGNGTINKGMFYGHYKHTGNFSFGSLGIGDGLGASITNNTTLFVSSSIGGTGAFIQGVNSTLNYSGSADIGLTAANFNATAAGNIINYSRAGNQNLYNAHTYNNLVLSGSGLKDFLSGVTINGKLSIQGTATVTSLGAVHYPAFGVDATLEYAGSTPQTSTDIEFKNTGGPKNLIINNAAGVTLHASRIINGTVTLSNGIFKIPASTILTIANGNAIAGTGFGTAKHINTQVSGANQGFLRANKIAANSSYLFPLGNGTYYLPCTLTPSDVIANNTFSASVFEGVTDNGLPNGNAMADKSNMVDAVWTINNNIASTTLPVNMVLGWSGLEGVNFSTLADNLIGIAHYDNPAWGNFTGSGNQLTNTATRLGVTTFSPFAVGKLGAFNSGILAELKASAAFKTTNLKNTNIATLIKKDRSLIKVFPNPVSNKLQLLFTVNSNNKMQLTITSADGKILYCKPANLQSGENIITVDVSRFLKGSYFIKSLFSDGHIVTSKFIK